MFFTPWHLDTRGTSVAVTRKSTTLLIFQPSNARGLDRKIQRSSDSPYWRFKEAAGSLHVTFLQLFPYLHMLILCQPNHLKTWLQSSLSKIYSNVNLLVLVSFCSSNKSEISTASTTMAWLWSSFPVWWFMQILGTSHSHQPPFPSAFCILGLWEKAKRKAPERSCNFDLASRANRQSTANHRIPPSQLGKVFFWGADLICRNM